MSDGLKTSFTLAFLAATFGAATPGWSQDPSATPRFLGPASTRILDRTTDTLSTSDDDNLEQEILDALTQEHPLELECPPDTAQTSLPGRGNQWTWCQYPDGTKEGPHVELRSEVDLSRRDRPLRRLRIETNFSDGVPDGEFAVWDDDTLLVEGRYEAGVPIGEWLRHDSKGERHVIAPGRTSP